MTATGEFQARRGAQAVDWMHDLLQQRLLAALEADPAVAARMAELESEVRAGRARRRWRLPRCCRWSGSVIRWPRHELGTQYSGAPTARPKIRTRRCCSPRSGRSRACRSTPPCGWCRSWPSGRRWPFPTCASSPRCWPPSGWRAPRRMAAVIAEVKPDLILHFGVSSRARGFEIEQRARNACRSMPDAAGCLPRGATLRDGGADVLRTSLPVPHLVLALKRRGIPAYASRDAGAYLCNAVLYHSLQVAADRLRDVSCRLRARAGHPGASGRSQSRPGRRLSAHLAAGRRRRSRDHRRLPRPPVAAGAGRKRWPARACRLRATARAAPAACAALTSSTRRLRI